LDTKLRAIRQSLSGNYRLPTHQLLAIGRGLIALDAPTIGYLASFFSKDPLAQAYAAVISFLDCQVQIESTRKQVPSKGPQDSLVPKGPN
jgi:hypothetical protein